MTARRGNDSGQVTVFVVILTTALLAVAGLVADGGVALAAKRRAGAEADAAARAGVQALAVDAYRRGEPIAIDPPSATAAAEDYLRQTGHTGVVKVVGDTVEVTVTIEQPTALLGVVGVSHFTLTAVGRARLAGGAS